MNLNYKVPNLTDAQKEREHAKLRSECRKLLTKGKGNLVSILQSDFRALEHIVGIGKKDETIFPYHFARNDALNSVMEWIETESDDCLLTASSQTRVKAMMATCMFWMLCLEEYKKRITPRNVSE